MRAALLLVLVACAGAPPRTVTVGIDLPPEVRVAAWNARERWCAAVGYCPELVAFGGDGFVRVRRFGDDWIAAAHQTRDLIEVSPLWLDHDLTGAMLHEWGHFGIDGEVESSWLMKARHADEADFPDVPDPAAIEAWCAQQGCG